jgi:hypothetical protein
MSKKRGIYRVVYRETSSRLGHGYGYIRIIHGWIIWVSIQMDSAGYANRIKRHLDFFCMCYPGVSGYSTIQRYIPGWISSSQGPGYYPDYPVPKSDFKRLLSGKKKLANDFSLRRTCHWHLLGAIGSCLAVN